MEWESCALFLPTFIRLLGVKQDAVAKRAGISPALLSLALHGKRNLTNEQITRIEQAVLAELVTTQRAEQGLPATVKDAAALRSVAQLVKAGRGAGR